jgi:hypothetical protein
VANNFFFPGRPANRAASAEKDMTSTREANMFWAIAKLGLKNIERFYKEA